MAAVVLICITGQNRPFLRRIGDRPLQITPVSRGTFARIFNVLGTAGFSASNGRRYKENRIRFIDLEHKQFGICFALFCRSTSALIFRRSMADVIQNEEFFDRVGNRLLAVNLEATVFKGKGIHVFCKFDL